MVVLCFLSGVAFGAVRCSGRYAELVRLDGDRGLSAGVLGLSFGAAGAHVASELVAELANLLDASQEGLPIVSRLGRGCSVGAVC
jgi:hypothetical protein